MSSSPFIKLNPNAHTSPLHFAHANGYPPQAYFPLLERLSERFYVSAMEMKPLWVGSDPRGVKDWGDFTGELIAFLGLASPAETGKKPVVGVGHSLGGTVTLMAALQRPELFQALILIDPPFFLPVASLLWHVFYRLGLASRLHPLVKGAVKRRNDFENRETMFAHYRKKKVFERIDDRGLWAYVDSLAKPAPSGGLELRYSPAWETRVYVIGALRDWKTWQEMRGFRLPVLIMRPEHQPATPIQTVQRFQQVAPQTVVRTIPDTTHLAPLEKPDVVANLIFEFLG